MKYEEYEIKPQTRWSMQASIAVSTLLTLGLAYFVVSTQLASFSLAVFSGLIIFSIFHLYRILKISRAIRGYTLQVSERDIIELRHQKEVARVYFGNIYYIHSNRLLRRFEISPIKIYQDSQNSPSLRVPYDIPEIEKITMRLTSLSHMSLTSNSPLRLTTSFLRRSRYLLGFFMSIFFATASVIMATVYQLSFDDRANALVNLVAALLMIFFAVFSLSVTIVRIDFENNVLSIKYLLRKKSIALEDITSVSAKIEPGKGGEYSFGLDVVQKSGKKFRILGETGTDVLQLWYVIDRSLQEQRSRTKKLSDRNSI